MRPHRWQPTRLLCPQDSPGKNTQVGCHFLLPPKRITVLKCIHNASPIRCTDHSKSVKKMEKISILIFWMSFSISLNHSGKSSFCRSTRRSPCHWPACIDFSLLMLFSFSFSISWLLLTAVGNAWYFLFSHTSDRNLPFLKMIALSFTFLGVCFENALFFRNEWLASLDMKC